MTILVEALLRADTRRPTAPREPPTYDDDMTEQENYLPVNPFGFVHTRPTSASSGPYMDDYLLLRSMGSSSPLDQYTMSPETEERYGSSLSFYPPGAPRSSIYGDDDGDDGDVVLISFAVPSNMEPESPLSHRQTHAHRHSDEDGTVQTDSTTREDETTSPAPTLGFPSFARRHYHARTNGAKGVHVPLSKRLSSFCLRSFKRSRDTSSMQKAVGERKGLSALSTQGLFGLPCTKNLWRRVRGLSRVSSA